jgi:cell division protein FtsB
MDGSDRSRIGSLMLWVGALALGGWFATQLAQANREAAETIEFVRRVEEDNRALRRTRDGLETLNQALEMGDPVAVRQTLQRYGYVPDDRVMIIETPR